MQAEETEQDLIAKHHYPPVAPSIFWKPGCGVRPPDGHVCEMGLFLTFTRQYVDLQVTKKVRVDNTKHTITVKLDTWSTSTVHSRAAVHPETVPLTANTTDMNVAYTTKVVDYKNRVLFTGSVRMVPAP